jgi:hypothetical protein
VYPINFGFEPFGRREIVARFDGGTISSDGGALLVRRADKRLNLLPRLAECFLDGRKQDLVAHSVHEMLAHEFAHLIWVLPQFPCRLIARFGPKT